MGGNICDLSLGYGFLAIKPDARMTKEKIGILDFIKTKNYCASKDTIRKVKQPAEYEKVIANHIPDKGLVSIIHKEL